MSVLLNKYGRIFLLPIFALASFLAAFFYFGYPGGYDAPTVAQLPPESMTAPASTLGALPLFPPTEKGTLLVDGLHGNDFTTQELSVLLARVADRGYQVEVAGEASRFGGFSSLDSGSRLAQLQEKLRRADSLAGISNYGLVDVNTEVFRRFNQKFKRIIEPLEGAGVTPQLLAGAGPAGWLAQVNRGGQGLSSGDQGLDGLQGLESGLTPNLDILRRYMLSSGLGDSQAQVLPDFPLKVNGPNIYYLYVGPSQ